MVARLAGTRRCGQAAGDGMTRRALISTNHLDTWAGSELVVLELAEGLLARGWTVTLHAPFYRDGFATAAIDQRIEWVKDFADLADVGAYDLVYSQHGALTGYWARQSGENLFGADRPAYVFAHLSPKEPLEQPSSPAELHMADLVLANSPETLASLTLHGGVFAKAQVMPNPAPAVFGDAVRPRAAGQATRLLVVSNHVPEELAGAIPLLKEAGLQVARMGLGHGPRRLLPDDLAQADAVVTIGKTVQYAARAGCPVFCYDRFGGPGWLTPDNTAAAERANFSGRCTPTSLAPHHLANALGAVPGAAVDWATQMTGDVPQRFRWEHWLDRIEALCSPGPRAAPEGDWKQAWALAARARSDQDHFFGQMRDVREQLQRAVARNKALRVTIARQKEAIK